MRFNFFFISFLILLSISSVNAVEINIYYPNNNTTTDIYYSEGEEYIHILNNTIDKNLTVLIIKNQYEIIDVITNPVKVFNYVPVLFYIIIFIGILSVLIYVGIRVVKKK